MRLQRCEWTRKKEAGGTSRRVAEEVRKNQNERLAVPARARISVHTNKSLPSSYNIIPPSPSRPHPSLNTATQAPATPALNPHPNNSLRELQHVSLRKDESLHARNVTCIRCNPYERLAVPARARIRQTQTQAYPAPAITTIPPQDRVRPLFKIAFQA